VRMEPITMRESLSIFVIHCVNYHWVSLWNFTYVWLDFITWVVLVHYMELLWRKLTHRPC